MKKINGWEIFFNNHALNYLNENFTFNTFEEVNFIEEELKLPVGSSILDIGCGTGRHSLELARRGYRVTGIDISENMLLEGIKIANSENLDINFIHADAAEFISEKTFDACICLCEGAFGLLSGEDDPFERDEKILKNIHKMLKPNSRFILTALNGLKMIRQYNEKDIDNGRFDPLGIVETYPLSEILEDTPDNILIKEKGFLATELKMMLKNTGFKVENIWGGTAGNWKRERLKMDEMELMVISRKI
ncbi:MAG: cyclopropane-fatty-acyl-phospholipid synthase [Marinitoga sp. 4572_148]|nr:MAG: cyclopropane-fatty-acyl-phospholipid synthase [Marinitoga sp. 4572_148]